MKITVITLFDGANYLHFAAVVEGEVSHKEFEKLAEDLNAVIADDDTPDDARQLFKTEMDTYPTAGDIKDVQALY